MSKALIQGLQALELLAEAPRTAADIARHLSVDRSTGWRILQSLSEQDWARQDPETKLFSLNVTHLYALAGNGHEHLALPSLILPMLERIRDRLGESAVFGVPRSSSMVYLVYAPSRHAVGVRESVGSVRPMHASALGKAYLSALDGAELDNMLKAVDFIGGTERAPKSIADLRHVVRAVRDTTYAVDMEECIAGVICVAAPAHIGHDHLLIGAVAVSGPRERIIGLGVERVVEVLREEMARLELSYPLDRPRQD
jgi:DNA-binding IclR family transcriptional regulator